MVPAAPLTVEEERDEARRGWADAIRRFAKVILRLKDEAEFWEMMAREGKRLLDLGQTSTAALADIEEFLRRVEGGPTSLPPDPSSGSAPCSHCGHRS